MSEDDNSDRTRARFGLFWPAVVILVFGAILVVVYVQWFAAPVFARHPGLIWEGNIRCETGSDRCCAISPSGRLMAAAVRRDSGVILDIWNTADRSKASRWTIPDWDPCTIVFSPDGRSLALGLSRSTPREGGDSESSVQVFDISRIPHGLGLRQDSYVGSGWLTSMAFSPDGHTLAILTTHGLKLWDVPKWRESIALSPQSFGASCVVFSPDGNYLAAALDTEVRVLDVKSREWKTTLRHPYGVPSVAFSPDNATLASNCHDGTVKLWDVAGGKLKSTVRTGYDLAGLVAYTRDGNKLVTFGTTYGTIDVGGIPIPTDQVNEGRVLLWDLRDTTSPTELNAKTTQVQQIVFCAAVGLMATVGDAEDNSIELWQLGKLIESLSPKE